MNRVVLIGRFTAKPELRYTASNVPFTRFSIAVNRPFNNQDGQRETDFINIVVWRKQAETICNYFDKGNQIALEGRIQTGSYDDKDGNKRYTTDVVVDQFHFIESKAQRAAYNAGGSPFDYQGAPDYGTMYNNTQSNYNQPQENVSPYDYQNAVTNDVNVEGDPFADFGDSVSIDDDFLD